MPHILRTASGFPAHYYSQESISEALREIWAGHGVNTGRVAKLHEATTIEGRHIAVPREDYYDLRGWEQPNALFAEVAIEVSEELLNRLFRESPIDPGEVSLFAFASTTGLSIPPLDAHLMNRLPFRPDLRRLPLYGLGCVAGAAGTARLADFLRGHPKEAALLVCIELCSLTIQKHDTSVANMIACGLFGDGAGAVLMLGDEHPLVNQAAARVVASRSVFFPHSEHLMGWQIRETGMEIMLSADVPKAVERSLREPVEGFLEEHGMEIDDVERWVCHPGGPRVIAAIETALGLNGSALDASRDVLRRVGNVSSASVLVLLDEILREDPPTPGSTGVMMAMGPGFVAEMVLLRW